MACGFENGLTEFGGWVFVGDEDGVGLGAVAFAGAAGERDEARSAEGAFQHAHFMFLAVEQFECDLGGEEGGFVGRHAGVGAGLFLQECDDLGPVGAGEVADTEGLVGVHGGLVGDVYGGAKHGGSGAVAGSAGVEQFEARIGEEGLHEAGGGDGVEPAPACHFEPGEECLQEHAGESAALVGGIGGELAEDAYFAGLGDHAQCEDAATVRHNRDGVFGVFDTFVEAQLEIFEPELTAVGGKRGERRPAVGRWWNDE